MEESNQGTERFFSEISYEKQDSNFDVHGEFSMLATCIPYSFLICVTSRLLHSDGHNIPQ